MSASDELRRLLDERGVRWWDYTPGRTGWESPILGEVEASETYDGKLVLDAGYESITVEQAVTATLGPDECHIEVKDNLRESEGTGDVWYECDACHWQIDYYAVPPKVHINYCPNCGRKVMDE